MSHKMKEMSDLETALYITTVREKIEPLLHEINRKWGQYCNNSERIIQELFDAKLTARPEFPITKSGRHKLNLRQRNKSILGVIEQYAGKRLVIIPWNHSLFPETSHKRLYKRGRLVELPIIESEHDAILDKITPLHLLQEAYADKDVIDNCVGYVWYEIGEKNRKHPRVTGFIENIEGKIISDTAKGLVRIEDFDKYSKHIHAAKHGHILNIVVSSVNKKEKDAYQIQLGSFPVKHTRYQDASYLVWPDLSTTHVCPKKKWMMKWLRAMDDVDALLDHGVFSKEIYFCRHDVAAFNRAQEFVNKKKGYNAHINPFFVNEDLKNFRDKLVNDVVIEVKVPPKGQIRRFNLDKSLQELFMQKYMIKNQDRVLR